MLPVLYSFRRCPYAIRARMALCYAGVQVELREVLLKDKPLALLQASPKGTVPVLVLANGQVVDESYEVMHWALTQADPDQWWGSELQLSTAALIEENDTSFKIHLDRYKYAGGNDADRKRGDRSTAHASTASSDASLVRTSTSVAEESRRQAEQFLSVLELRLNSSRYLLRQTVSLADVAIFPFIRQFAFVDKAWFDSAPYPRLQQWLAFFLECAWFEQVMKKYPPWRQGDAATVFPE